MISRLSVAVTLGLASLLATQAAAQQPGAAPAGLRTLRERASYSFGMSMGSTLKKQGVDIDVNLLLQGIKDAAGGRTKLTENEAMEAMQAFEKQMVAQQAEKSKQFLADNQRRPGVQVTKNGLQYKVLRPGKGPRPKATDVVRVNYKASFTDGTEFETNGEKPFTTPVNQVIPGWQEALQLMPVGSKWLLVIPPALAYGSDGSPPAIAPNTALVFELELLEIAKPPAGAMRNNLRSPTR